MSAPTTARDRLASTILDGFAERSTRTSWQELAEHAADALIRVGWVPPADLPATLESDDDLAAVCLAVGLVEAAVAGHPNQRRWRDPEGLSDVEVAAHPSGWSLTYARPQTGASHGPFRVEAPWTLAAPVGPLFAALRAAS